MLRLWIWLTVDRIAWFVHRKIMAQQFNSNCHRAIKCTIVFCNSFMCSFSGKLIIYWCMVMKKTRGEGRGRVFMSMLICWGMQCSPNIAARDTCKGLLITWRTCACVYFVSVSVQLSLEINKKYMIVKVYSVHNCSWIW